MKQLEKRRMRRGMKKFAKEKYRMYWEGVTQVGKLVWHFSNISPEVQPICEDVLKMRS